METETNHYIIELNNRVRKYSAAKRESEIIKETIAAYNKII